MKIISFEGIEGVGKSTQINLLYEYLSQTGKSVKKYREPGSTDASEKIRDILLDSSLTLSSRTELLLMYASRSELVAREIKSSKYDYILLDCSPSINLMNQNALLFSKNVMIPVSMEYMSLVGIKQLIKNIHLLNKTFSENIKVSKEI